MSDQKSADVAEPESARPHRSRRNRRTASRSQRRRARTGYVFVLGYTVLLVGFGVGPVIYAAYLAFTDGSGSFVAFENFTNILQDFRFMPAVTHVAQFLVIWLIFQTVFVVALALIVQQVAVRWLSSMARFVYYIPGAFAGAASVLLWMFLLDPSVSPVAPLLRAFGFETFINTIALDNLPVIFTVIVFWTGAGGWIVIMFGALNSISTEVLEAARVDGASMVQMAWYIQVPLIKKWIAYMAVISLAVGTQLFVEPRVLSQASKGVVPPDYSLNQLGYLYAFRQGDFNGSAAISLTLLVVSVLLASVFVIKGGLFERH